MGFMGSFGGVDWMIDVGKGEFEVGEFWGDVAVAPLDKFWHNVDPTIGSSI